MGSVHGGRNASIERIDENTWRNDDGGEISARGLTLTVEFGDKTKAEILEAVAEVKDENARLRELCKKLYDFAWFENPGSTELNFAEDMEELGIKTEV